MIREALVTKITCDKEFEEGEFCESVLIMVAGATQEQAVKFALERGWWTNSLGLICPKHRRGFEE